MSSPVLPTLIIGPAIIKWNGFYYYTKAGIKVSYKRDTWKVTSDTDGTIDERMKSQKSELTFQPVGMIKLGTDSALAAFFPYGVSAIGKSMFSGTNSSQLVIITKFGGGAGTGQTITYTRGALTKPPQLRLKPTDTLLGDMTFTCLGSPATQPSTANAWNTLADAVFADATFDETMIVSDTYGAAWGGGAYASMGAKEGFEITIGHELAEISSEDYGLVDIILKGLTAAASFTPSNLTEANLYALLNWDGASYILPGQSVANAGNNLIITGSGNGTKTLTATLNKVGPVSAELMYGIDKHRFGAVAFANKRTWTTGVANAPFTFAVA